MSSKRYPEEFKVEAVRGVNAYGAGVARAGIAGEMVAGVGNESTQTKSRGRSIVRI